MALLHFLVVLVLVRNPAVDFPTKASSTIEIEFELKDLGIFQLSSSPGNSALRHVLWPAIVPAMMVG
jgi:hypothetical protein